MIDVSEYTSELMLLCNILLFICVLVQAYMVWTARRARDQHYDSWQKAKWDLTKSDAEKDRLQAKVDKLTEELAEVHRVLDGKGEGFVMVRHPRLVECKYEASMSGCRVGVFRFTVEDIDPGEDAERLTKVLRSGKILIKGVEKE